MKARSRNHAFHAEHGNSLSAMLILVVGMLVLSASGSASAKEPSAEELDAAAQACREESMWSSPAGTRARLMQQVGRLMSSVILLLLMVGLLVLSVSAAARSVGPLGSLSCDALGARSRVLRRTSCPQKAAHRRQGK